MNSTPQSLKFKTDGFEEETLHHSSPIRPFGPRLKSFLSHVNQGHTFEALCLWSYYFIHLPVQGLDEDDVKHLRGIIYDINGQEFLSFILGSHSLCRNPYSGLSDISDCFFRLKLSYAYPHLKIAECLKPYKTKEKLFHLLNTMVELDAQLTFLPDQIQDLQKYRDYVFFSMKNMVFYLSRHDPDFLTWGRQHFSKFDQTCPKETIHHFIHDALNRHFKPLEDHPDDSHVVLIEDPDLKKIYDYIDDPSSCDHSFFQKKLNPHQKGQLGEHVFSQMNQGEVVGYKGGKTDVIEHGKNISLKTSFTSHWNHHLAYLQPDQHQAIIEAIDQKKPLSSLQGLDWAALVHRFISSTESVDDLVFQKIQMDDLHQQPLDIQLWRFNKDVIIDMIEQQQFMFQNHHLLLFNQQDYFMKLTFKKRSHSYQVLIQTDEASLNQAIQQDLGFYDHPLKPQKTFKP